jgi:outer membrane lipoprotein carrier protein
MRHRSSRFIAVASLLLGCFGAAADDTQTLFAKLDGFRAIHAQFEQQTAQDTEVHSGELWIEKPNRFRIVTEMPWQQTLISDGSTFWNYDADLEQVTITEMEHDLLKFPILLFSSTEAELEKTFSVSTFRGEVNTVYVLEPRGEQQFFKQMTIVFNGNLPKTISIVDSLAQKTRIRLIQADIASQPPAELFQFVPPSGTDIVDQRPLAGDSKPPQNP